MGRIPKALLKFLDHYWHLKLLLNMVLVLFKLLPLSLPYRQLQILKHNPIPPYRGPLSQINLIPNTLPNSISPTASVSFLRDKFLHIIHATSPSPMPTRMPRAQTTPCSPTCTECYAFSTKFSTNRRTQSAQMIIAPLWTLSIPLLARHSR